MAAYGIPHDEIRRAVIDPGRGVPISAPTLRRAFRQELANGRSTVKLQVADTLLKLAKSTPSVAIFLGKTILRLKEKDTPPASPPDATPYDLTKLSNAELDQFEAIMVKLGGPAPTEIRRIENIVIDPRDPVETRIAGARDELAAKLDDLAKRQGRPDGS